MISNLGGVEGKVPFSVRFVIAFNRVEIASERCLCIYDNVRWPGNFMITSGRIAPAFIVTRPLDHKSQWALRPDNSSTFRSVCSPHRPLVFGAARSALTSFAVSVLTLF